MLSAQLDEFITMMPKVELHLHLEGTITPRTLIELAGRNGVELPVEREEVEAALAGCGVTPDRRPQTLTLDEWACLATALGPCL